MHDIWNPWHGCTKCSEGCQNCYMYYLDSKHSKTDSSHCYKTAAFNYPLQRNRKKEYKIKSGELIRVCMTSDFFLEDADPWRDEAWEIMHKRSDVKFFLLTKRPQRVKDCLPKNWGNGWDNIFFNVTCENQERADERIPIMLDLPFKHKGIMTAPLIGPIAISKYLAADQIEQVICGGENYDGSRPCHYEWVLQLREECKKADVTFCFIETGTYFVRDGKKQIIKSKLKQTEIAYKSGLNELGKSMRFVLRDPYNQIIPEYLLYEPHYRSNCNYCGNRLICNGCSDCGRCEGEIICLQRNSAVSASKAYL